MSSDNELPAVKWLGRGLDMTSLTPFDINSVKILIKVPRIVSVEKDERTHAVTIGGVEYNVPRCVFATDNSGSIQSSYVTYASGAEALRGFETDPGATGRLAVSANLASYPLIKALPADYQFAFFNFNSDAYTAGVQEYIDFLNDRILVKAISVLPIPFTGSSEAIEAYTRFFQEIGSHVITSVVYGARANLSAWASNHYPDVNANWSTDVTASVRGINSSGDFDETVLDQPQYQVFLTLVQRLLTVHGGDESLATSLMQGQYDFNTLKQWAISAGQNPDLVTMKTTELWTILRDSDNSTLRSSADSIEEAFRAITTQQHKQQITSLAILSIESGLAEFGILTPSAIVGVGGPLPAADATTQQVIGLSETKVRWGKAETDEQKNVIIPFFIVNDGSPLDFYISRGTGKARVLINGVYYGDEGDIYGTKWFYQVPIAT